MDKIKASQFADLAYYSRFKPLANYQIVTYLEGTGTQYIDTGIVPANSDLVTADFQLTNTTDIDNTLFYIDNGASNVSAYGLSMASPPKIYVCGWGNHFDRVADMDSDRHTITICNGVFTLDNSTISTSTQSTQSPTVTRSIKPFAWDRNSNIIIRGKVRVFGFTIMSGSNVKRLDLVPCYRKADSKPGMYDTVTNTFFTNSGTGEFTVGGNV